MRRHALFSPFKNIIFIFAQKQICDSVDIEREIDSFFCTRCIGGGGGQCFNFSLAVVLPQLRTIDDHSESAREGRHQWQ